jgi:RND family efflux transporter MFP subunit
VGKRVAKNDVLVQIDTGDIDLEIERIRNEITAAKRKVELGSPLGPEVLNARDTLENLERQMKAGAYPAAEFAKQQRLFQQLEQRKELDEVNARLVLQNFENTLRSKEREKAKMTITAPSDGVITLVTTRVGDLIGSNSPIATIISVGRTVEAKISEENFSAVKLGQKASVRLLTFGADQYNGKVTKILPAADASTRRYTLFLELALPDGRVLMPGLTGEVSIVIEQRANAVTIPRRAVVGDEVFVAADGVVTRRKVTKGFEGLNEIEITAGLKAGELVVVEQQDRFHDGERVRAEVVAN